MSTTAMPQQRFRVWITDPKTPDGEPVFHEVTVRHVDRVYAERQTVGMFGPNTDLTDTPVTMTTAWAWAALKRMGVYEGPVALFLERDCQEFESVDDDETVDPTPESQATPSP